jgi:FkbM family methyltransferase
MCRQILDVLPAEQRTLRLLDAVLTAAGRPGDALPAYRKALGILTQIAESQTTAAGLRRLRALGFSPEAILDIGAYEGEWMRLAKAVFPEARVLMIEAQPDKAARLAEACAPYGGSVEHCIALLGAENRPAVPFYQMQTPYGSTGSSIYEEQTTFNRKVVSLPMHRLDDVLASRAEERYGLVKLDVQGAELDILRGAPRTLRDAEAIVLEAALLPFNKGAPLFDEVVSFMKTLGLVAFDILEHYRVSSGVLLQCDVMFLREGSGLRPTEARAFR